MAWSNPTRATIPGVSAHCIHYFIWTVFDRRRLFCVSQMTATKTEKPAGLGDKEAEKAGLWTTRRISLVLFWWMRASESAWML